MKIGHPTFNIETPFGPARIIVQDSEYCCLESFLGQGTDQGLTINGVVYRVSLRAQFYNGGWTYCRYGDGPNADHTSLFMTRVKWQNASDMDATPAARKKAADVLFPLINQFFRENPDAARQGRVSKLQADLVRQEEKVQEARRNQEEAQKQVDSTLAELYSLLPDEERKNALRDEDYNLSLELNRCGLREVEIQDRRRVIEDMLANCDGERGSQRRYLTRAEILELADHFQGIGDDLGGYLLTTKFSPSAGQCYEVPLTHEEAIMIDHWDEFTQ